MEQITLTAQQLEARGKILCESCRCVIAQWSAADKSKRTLQIVGLRQVALWTSPCYALRGKCRCGDVLYTLQLPEG